MVGRLKWPGERALNCVGGRGRVCGCRSRLPQYSTLLPHTSVWIMDLSIVISIIFGQAGVLTFC